MKTKNFFQIALFALLAIGASSCKDDEIRYITVEFEDMPLETLEYANRETYVEAGVTFSNLFDTVYQTWDGFAISRQVDMETPGYTNQFSVYAPTGAGGSRNFAVAHYSEYNDIKPTFAFDPGVEHKLADAYFCLTTYTYLTIATGNDGANFARGFTHDSLDIYTLELTGINAAGKTTGHQTIRLADYTKTEPVLFDTWTKVKLTDLGLVNKVEIKVNSTDKGTYGINTPTYFAIDNLRFEE